MAEKSLKKFWKSADIKFEDNQFTVHLDNRKLRTPNNNVISLPKNRFPLALLIANEWQIQEKVIKPHALPLTSLTSRALDQFKFENERQKVCHDLIRYFDTDAVW